MNDDASIVAFEANFHYISGSCALLFKVGRKSCLFFKELSIKLHLDVVSLCTVCLARLINHPSFALLLSRLFSVPTRFHFQLAPTERMEVDWLVMRLEMK